MKTKKGLKTPEQKLRLKAVEQVLKNGCRLSGFSLGNGLRVINIEKDDKLTAYGVSVEVLGALNNVNKACACGEKPYNTPQCYLTGQYEISCKLDLIVRRNNYFEVYFENGLFISRYKTVDYMIIIPPYHIIQKFFNRSTREPEIYQKYGYTYRAKPPNADSSWYISIIGRPKGRKSPSGAVFDVTYIGKGLTIGTAIHNMLTNTGKAVDRCFRKK